MEREREKREGEWRERENRERGRMEREGEWRERENGERGRMERKKGVGETTKKTRQIAFKLFERNPHKELKNKYLCMQFYTHSLLPSPLLIFPMCGDMYLLGP